MMWKNQNSHILGDVKWYKYFEKVLEDLFKNSEYIYHMSQPSLIDVYPREIKINVSKKSYTQMFIAALFKYPQIRKQCKCPSRSEWIKITRFVQIMDKAA